MENQITCPKCKRIIANNPIIDNAAIGGEHKMGSEFIICECGERISYWTITALLRDQQTFGKKIRNWFHTTIKS